VSQPPGESLIDLDHLEPVRCNLCGADDTDVLATRSRFDVPLTSVLCRRCGLMYINPRMSSDQYRDFYKTTYRKFIRVKDSVDVIFEKEVLEGKNIFDFSRARLTPGQRVLEIGCGPGGILAAFQSEGMAVHGVEPSLEESAFARARGIPVDTLLLEEFPETGPKFDFVILSRSLNHLADPSAALAKAWTLLGDNKYLFVNLLDFPTQCRFGLVAECAQADHLYMFSPEIARVLLEKTGFEIIKMDVAGDHLSWWDQLFGAPRFHMKILARRVEPKPMERIVFPSPQAIRQKIRRNQQLFFLRRLVRPATYRHWLAVVIKRVFGEGVLTRLKR
jgi:SAM-dependent methyltransferase